MSIRDLRTFLAIAESGSFTAAAHSVHRTQSAITVQMKTLEEKLEIRLFDRSKRPPVLTASGRAFVSKCPSSDNLRLIRRLQKEGSLAHQG